MFPNVAVNEGLASSTSHASATERKHTREEGKEVSCFLYLKQREGGKEDRGNDYSAEMDQTKKGKGRPVIHVFPREKREKENASLLDPRGEGKSECGASPLPKKNNQENPLTLDE